ncbi:hypothetical protein DEU38_10766 [Rhodococcus sp. AG1013]|nr:hypothetical protein DEU38_10766 [Rhodococcus sp. AG1013]
MRWSRRRTHRGPLRTTKMTVELPDTDVELLVEMAEHQASTMTAALARSIRMTSFVEKHASAERP